MEDRPTRAAAAGGQAHDDDARWRRSHSAARTGPKVAAEKACRGAGSAQSVGADGLAQSVHLHPRVTTDRAWSGIMSLGETWDESQQPIGSPSRRFIPFHDAGGGSDDPPSPKIFPSPKEVP